LAGIHAAHVPWLVYFGNGFEIVGAQKANVAGCD
jgi:hypothetical protein